MADFFLNPGQEASAHNHDYYEFFIVLQGEFTEDFGKGRTKVTRRQGHILRPEDVHCLKNDSDRPALLRNIAVRRDTFEAILAETGFFSGDDMPVSDPCGYFSLDESAFHVYSPDLRIPDEEHLRRCPHFGGHAGTLGFCARMAFAPVFADAAAGKFYAGNLADAGAFRPQSGVHQSYVPEILWADTHRLHQ